jgi:hypothetical protein
MNNPLSPALFNAFPYKPRFWATIVVLITIGVSTVSAQIPLKKRLESEFILDSHYSEYNFTDVTYPKAYQGVDTWFEHRLQIWGDTLYKNWGAYISVLGAKATSWRYPLDLDFFKWQSYGQISVGFQFYPFYNRDIAKDSLPFSPRDTLQDSLKNSYKPWYGLRLFALGAARGYIREDASTSNPFSDFSNWDVQVGADYYYDNLFDTIPGRITFFAWSNLSYRLTNFSFNGYRNILWTGNIKAGPKIWRWAEVRRISILIPYAAVDWTYTRTCPCRWWENYLRVGGGIRFYPKAYRYRNSNKKNSRFWRRLHIYVESLYNAVWLGDKAPSEVKNWDIRVGIGLSTPGFIRREEGQ